MLIQIWKDFSSLVFPITCYSCRNVLAKNEDYLCIHCRSNLSVAKIDPENNSFLDTHSYIVGFTFALIYFQFSKGGVSQKVLHSLKYGSNKDIGTLLGRWFGEYMMSHYDIKRFDGLIPVPLHKRRERIRGFNQSEVIANGISESTQIPVMTDILERIVYTDTQTKKNKLQRLENIKNVFAIKNPENIQGKSFLIVDDVVTTGATILECGELCIKSGVKEFGICVLAAKDIT